MDFKKVPKKNRPMPFWSWNEKLDIEETVRQIDIMDKFGMGGFIMHARGGLETSYMGDEWFLNVKESINAAQKRGMYAWAYDENGWPSGFGDGIITGRGEQNQQKYLRYDFSKEADAHTITFIGDKRFYYEVNPFYVDTLNGRVTEEFIKEIYEPYYEKFKNDITGFFTDEPQISRNGIPWSEVLPDAYLKEYGEELLPHLSELFEATDDYKKTRKQFWRLVTILFSENYFKKIYDWCCERGLELTGHMSQEETFLQVTENGAVMPHYEYFTVPGMDSVTRNIITDLTPYQLGSATQQLGKRHVLSEAFAMCGHNVSFEELKGIYEHQMAHGATILCQHLEGYSLRGIRKRDFPPAMYYQQPWWEYYDTFCEAMARIGMILEDGEIEVDTLLMHPQTSVWIMFDNENNEPIEEYYQEFKKIVNGLDKKHIPFHLGDEILIERHGRVEGDRFIIGNVSYKTVIIPPHLEFFENTKKLLDEFKENGGRVITPDEVSLNTDVVDNPEIIYTKRKYQGFDVYYFINPTTQTLKANIKKGSKQVDIKTGELLPFDGEIDFAPYESVLVVDDGTKRERLSKKELKNLDISGKWHIDYATENILTLDFCDYYFNGELIEKNGYVLNIQDRACALKEKVNLRQVYRFSAEYISEDMCLLCETPDIFKITINGHQVQYTPEYGTMIDVAFKKIPIADFLHIGENEICFEVDFCQSQEVYDNFDKAVLFESEKNKFKYDMEIEPCYLVGSFGVRLDGETENLKNNAFRFDGRFVITNQPKEIDLSNIEKQGFPFFAGKMKLSRDIITEDENYQISFNKKGVNAISVKVNGQECGDMIWTPYKLDISHALSGGNNHFELTFCNNLRNMLGPHHAADGEVFAVGTHSFFKENCVWNGGGEYAVPWDARYCFVETSVNE